MAGTELSPRLIDLKDKKADFLLVALHVRAGAALSFVLNILIEHGRVVEHFPRLLWLPGLMLSCCVDLFGPQRIVLRSAVLGLALNFH